MAEDPTQADPPEGDVDPGEPVAVLAGLEVEPGGGFFGRVQRAIGRRRAISQVAEFLWSGPIEAIVEFLRLIFGSVAELTREQGERRGNSNDH